MTCLAISPFVSACPIAAGTLAVTGLAITSFVTAYYMIKNGGSLVSALKNCMQDSKEMMTSHSPSLFSRKSKNDRELEDPLLRSNSFSYYSQ